MHPVEVVEGTGHAGHKTTISGPGKGLKT
jgi:hypothetical protein